MKKKCWASEHNEKKMSAEWEKQAFKNQSTKEAIAVLHLYMQIHSHSLHFDFRLMNKGTLSAHRSATGCKEKNTRKQIVKIRNELWSHVLSKRVQTTTESTSDDNIESKQSRSSSDNNVFQCKAPQQWCDKTFTPANVGVAFVETLATFPFGYLLP